MKYLGVMLESATFSDLSRKNVGKLLSGNPKKYLYIIIWSLAG